MKSNKSSSPLGRDKGERDLGSQLEVFATKEKYIGEERILDERVWDSFLGDLNF